MTKRYGLFVLGRVNFDVEFARQRVSEALSALGNANVGLVGAEDMLFDDDAVDQQMAEVEAAEPDGIIILQATFTDAVSICRIAERFRLPLHIWAVPEPREGGRLRLNSFCGLNLASHALGLRHVPSIGLYADPLHEGIIARLQQWLGQTQVDEPALRAAAKGDVKGGEKGIAAITGARIGRIGEHPAGFDTCAYDKENLKALAGVSLDELVLDNLFDDARDQKADNIQAVREMVGDLDGLAEVNQDELDLSLRLGASLKDIQSKGRYDAFAIRCWPETFTEYGGAVCGPVALMGEQRVPCACEADVYGTLTSLMLQGIADAPVFLADVVDMDDASDTAVVWHCGQAPRNMADPGQPVAATIHSNRRMPLLFQFALRPGRVTLARISQARGRTIMVIATGEVRAAKPSFSGTSGVVHFDAPVGKVRERLISGGIEHHLTLVYGDHRDAVENAAHRLNLPVLDLVA